MSAFIDTAKVQAAVKALDAANGYLSEAKANLSSLRGLGGQQGYAIVVHGIAIPVAEMDRFYNPKLIRGREMIHLGALKALQAIIDQRTTDVAIRQAELRAIVGGAA